MSAKTATAAPIYSPSINGFAVSVPAWIPWTSDDEHTDRPEVDGPPDPPPNPLPHVETEHEDHLSVEGHRAERDGESELFLSSLRQLARRRLNQSSRPIQSQIKTTGDPTGPLRR